MSITFVSEQQRFLLTTAHTAYAFEVLGGKYLRHLYYGANGTEIVAPPFKKQSFAPYLPPFTYPQSPDYMANELSFFGSGDFRATALRICGADGTSVTDFTYMGYRIFAGDCERDGLPSARRTPETETLEVSLFDEVTGCTLRLYYTVFVETDVISRSLVLENGGAHSVKMEKCMPLELEIDRKDLEMLSFWGGHRDEWRRQRHPLHHGVQSICSRRGSTSHHHNSFFALCTDKTTEERGEVYGFQFVWSGSFLCEVEYDQMSSAKVLVGLGAENFGYTLAAGERFVSPEALMTYSADGLGGMARNWHRFTLEHILPPEAKEPHPVVLNTWEGSRFDIEEGMLLASAREAASLGFDMLVMDDGWFGARNHDHAGLGDWVVNPEKFPRGLAAFVDDVRACGIKFGIWIEPEMVNPDSDLYRAHPEWALAVPGREPLLSRHQLVLDMANDAVVSYLIDAYDKVFDGVQVDYFKWDMNRHLCGIYSAALPAERQGEVAYRYVRGVYRLMGWLRERFPDAFLETCAGGGGRYDLAMMTYGMQIWTSDNTNPYDRTRIQTSALLGYPAATMSCHVSNPKGDLRSLDFRYKVAVGGMLGYEFNILQMSPEIKAEIARQIAEYKGFAHIVRLGDYYPLVSPSVHDYAAYYYVTDDNREVLLSVIETANCKAGETKLLRVRRADAGATYTDRRSGTIYRGADLRRGIRIPLAGTPDSASLLWLVRD